MRNDQQTFDAVFAAVRAIPAGRVMTYGQVGIAAGGVAPRVVGSVMASVYEADEVPWHRVVGAQGHLAISRRSVELGMLQRKLLEGEGVEFLQSGGVDMARFGDAGSSL